MLSRGDPPMEGVGIIIGIIIRMAHLYNDNIDMMFWPIRVNYEPISLYVSRH